MPGEMFSFNFHQNNLRFKSSAGATVINSTNFLPNQWWYIECRLHDDDGDTNANFSWRFINLDTPTVEITEQTPGHVLAGTWTQNWSISSPSDHFTITLGPLVFMNDGNSTKRNVIRDWMLAKFAVEAASEPATPAEPATFFAQLNIRTR
jgi:hypothetical protein